MTDTVKHVNLLEVYHDSIDRSNFNTDTGDYVNGSYISKEIPTLKGEKHIEEGHLMVSIVKCPGTSLLRLSIEKFGEKSDAHDSITAIITQDVAREIGNQLSTTLFDPKYDLGLKLVT